MFQGELLVDLNSPLLFVRMFFHTGAVETLQYAIPLQLSFCGLPGYSQAFVGGSPRVEFTNALDFRAGR